MNFSEIQQKFSWIDLDRYDSMGDATLEQWARAFDARLLLRRYVDSRLGAYDWNTSSYGDWESDFDALFEESIQGEKFIRPEPIGPPIEWGAMTSAYYGGLGTVQLVDGGTLAAAWNDFLEDPRANKVQSYLLGAFMPSDDELNETFQFIERVPIDLLPEARGGDFLHKHGGLALLQIDLTAPDKVLLEDFQRIIGKLKDELEIGSLKRISQADREQWLANRVLLYFDISLFSHRHDLSVTQQQIGLLMFPKEFDVSLDDKIRRTVKKLAERIAKPGYVDAIYRQSDSEEEGSD